MDYSCDLNHIFTNLKAISKGLNLGMEILGSINGLPLFFLFPVENIDAPCVLVAAGFHGDEIAGCYGILRFLETTYQKLVKKINISFLPVVNPYGFSKRTRSNASGQDVNRGFCHAKIRESSVSAEGKILINCLPSLLNSSKDGFLSLHEDTEEERFYLYTFEESESPGIFSQTIKSAMLPHFEPYPNGKIEESVIKDGIIFNHHDGSFEDFLFQEGVPYTVCTETPGLSSFDRRVSANTAITEAFAKFFINPK